MANMQIACRGGGKTGNTDCHGTQNIIFLGDPKETAERYKFPMTASPYSFGPTAGGKPQSLVILLHGYGSNGQDLIDLAPYWAPKLPHTLFLSPDAPFPCEIGFGFQWFSLQSWAPATMLAGAEKAAAILNQFIDDHMKKYDIPANHVALVGFSQGTMMSLYVAPRREALAGVLGYSGALLGGEGLVGQHNISRPPICLIHGEMDPVVPVASWYHASTLLRQAGFDVTGHTTPGLVHSIDEAGIRAGGAFLENALG